MFDTMKIGKVIKEARIARNMTQMNLADAMGVSYQAVSNWERGNSMPDISKLEELCQVLNITVNDLLGILEPPTAPMPMAAEEMTVGQLMEAAPALPPAVVKERVREEKRRRKLDLDVVIALAPFLDEDTLNELMADVAVDDLDELAELAPLLRSDTLKQAVERCGSYDLDDLLPLAPFLDQAHLCALAERTELDDMGDLAGLAPFLSSELLERLVVRAAEQDPDILEDIALLAPFLSKGAVSRILKNLL